MDLKQCRKCHINKPLIEFHKYRRHNDGLQYHCKVCTLEKARERYYANPQKIMQYTNKYRQTEKGKLSYKKYEQSKNGKAVRSAYIQTKQGKEALQKALRKYQQSEHGKLARKLKYQSKKQLLNKG